MTGFETSATDKNLRVWLNAGPVVRGVGDGLTFVATTASASKGKASWVLRYRFGGREKEICRVAAGSPAHVVHGEVLDVIERQALERHVQRVGAHVLEAVPTWEAGLHVDEAPRGEQVRCMPPT